MQKSCLFLIMGILFAMVISGHSAGFADEGNQVAVIIQYSDAKLETLCVTFEEDEISGVDVLARSGLDTIMDVGSSMGVTLCQIDDVGCGFPAEDCFCQCMGGADCAYWNYFYREPNSDEWIYSVFGAAMRKVVPGSVEGWVWGDGKAPPKTTLTFENICRLPEPTVTVQVVMEVPPTPEPLEPTPTIGVVAAQSSPTATSTSLPKSAPTAALPSPTPSQVPTQQPASSINSNQSMGSYAGFVAMVFVLGAIGAFVWWRRR